MHDCRSVLADEREIGQASRVGRAEVNERLSALGTSVADRLQDGRRSSFAELLEAGEYGIALENLTDWLSEYELPITVRAVEQPQPWLWVFAVDV